MKVGIVGLGSIGKRHAINATTLGHDVHVYDPAVKGDFRFRYERDLYDWCDAAVIATPSQFHEAGLRACVERGKHALIEKPISTSDQSLREILDVAAIKKLTVMVGNNLRFHLCVLQAKLRIDAGAIGRPIWASFTCAQFGQKYIDEGVTLNTGAHEVDLALHLFGPAKVISANAHVADYGGVREPMRDDIADFVLQHESGARSTFHLNNVTPIEIREFRVIGHDGDLHCDLPARTLTTRLADGKLPNVTHTHNFKGTGSYDTDYFHEMHAFFDRIEGKDVPGATGADGLATLQVLLDVRKMAGLS